jgi:NAD+ synthase (glutamine-hydrolysing)
LLSLTTFFLSAARVILDLVKSLANMVKNSEYKRSQAPVGPKISTKSFNYDRIYPVTLKKI